MEPGTPRRPNWRSTPRRPSWLRELELALIFGLVLTGLGAVAIVWYATQGPVSVPIPNVHLTRDAAAALHLNEGVAVDTHGSFDALIEHPTATQSALGLASSLPSLAVTMLMLLMLVRLVRDARRVDPFTTDVARRLRRLAMIVVIAGPVAWAAETASRAALVGTADAQGWSVDISPLAPVAWLLIALGYFASAEVIGHGQAMRTELEGVV